MARRRNGKGFDELDAHIAKVRGLESLVRDSMPAVRTEVEKDAKRNAARGRDPSGKEWRESKTGGAVLRNAAGAISVAVSSTVILISVTGRYARHHLGIVRGSGPRDERARRVIPIGDIPKTTTAAIKRGASETFRKKMA